MSMVDGPLQTELLKAQAELRDLVVGMVKQNASAIEKLRENMSEEHRSLRERQTNEHKSLSKKAEGIARGCQEDSKALLGEIHGLKIRLAYYAGIAAAVFWVLSKLLSAGINAWMRSTGGG